MAKTTKSTAGSDKKPPTKSQLYSDLADRTDLSKKQVSQVFDELEGIIKKNLASRGPQQFTLPGLAKMTIKKKPATKAHTRPDPFNPGQTMHVKAKPASKQVKVTPLKNLKDMV